MIEHPQGWGGSNGLPPPSEATETDDVAYGERFSPEAKLALDSLEVPVGCVIVEEGNLIATGRNRTNETRNATRHAEMEALDVLFEQWQRTGFLSAEVAEKFSACSLYVTCEPCIMCAAALLIIGIKEVYYGCANDKFGGFGSILSMHLSSFEVCISSKASQVRGYLGFSFDVHALVLPVESSHGFAQLEFH